MTPPYIDVCHYASKRKNRPRSAKLRGRFLILHFAFCISHYTALVHSVTSQPGISHTS